MLLHESTGTRRHVQQRRNSHTPSVVCGEPVRASDLLARHLSKLLLATVILIFALVNLLAPSLNETGCVLLLMSVLGSGGTTAALYVAKPAWLRSDRGLRIPAQRLLLILLLSSLLAFTLLCGAAAILGRHAFTPVSGVHGNTEAHLRVPAVSAGVQVSETSRLVESPPALLTSASGPDADFLEAHPDEDSRDDEQPDDTDGKQQDAMEDSLPALLHTDTRHTGSVEPVSSLVPVAAPLSADASVLAPIPGLGVGLLCIIISVSRPNGVDYTTPLTRLLVGTCDRMVVYDGDKEQTRAFPWADVILRGPADVIAARQEEARVRRRDSKHNSTRTRTHWRTKHTLDYAFTLEYAYERRVAFPYALVLEDDIWMEEDFRRRLWEEVIFFRQEPPGPMPELHPWMQAEITASRANPHPLLSGLSRKHFRPRRSVSLPPSPFPSSTMATSRAMQKKMTTLSRQPPTTPPIVIPADARSLPARFTGKESRAAWLVWNLHYCGEFDEGHVYPHGSWFEFRACAQALLWRSGLLRPLIAFLKSHADGDLPTDNVLAAWLAEQQARVLLAAPSIVQHLGAQVGASTLPNNNKEVVERSRDRGSGGGRRDIGKLRSRRSDDSASLSAASSTSATPGAVVVKRQGPVCWADDFPPAAPRSLAWDREATAEEAAADPTRRTPVLLQLEGEGRVRSDARSRKSKHKKQKQKQQKKKG